MKSHNAGLVKKITSISVMMFMLVGCSIFNLGDQVLTASPAATFTVTSLNIQPSHQPTNLTETPALVVTYSPTVGSIPSNFITDRCLNVKPQPPADLTTQGMIVLYGIDSFLLDPKDNIRKTLKGMQADFMVSPNHKWLVSTFKDNQDKLWLLTKTANGEEQKPILWEENWFEIGGWLDNERIWVSHYSGPVLTVINLFSGEQQEITANFPGIETTESIRRYPLGVSSVVYNYSLDLAVYPRVEADGLSYLVMWGVQAGKVLAKVEHISQSPPSRPIWSADGTRIYVIESQSVNGSDNIVSLSQDGQVRQITHFGEATTDAKIFGLSLSPDGEKIAFWLSMGPHLSPRKSLAVLDLKTEKVINYCVVGPSEYGGLSYPIWSPENRYIVFANWYDTASNWTILVDTEQDWAANLAKDVTPEGWLLDTPHE